MKPYDRASRAAFWPEYLRGLAFLQLKQPASALAEFTRIVDHRGEDPTGSVYPLALLGIARAHAQAGDTGNAREAYQRFLSYWVAADQTARPFADARGELARLQ